MLYMNSLYRKCLFPELFAVLMLALSNTAASDNVGPEQAGSWLTPQRMEVPSLKRPEGSEDTWSQGSFSGHPGERWTDGNQHGLRYARLTRSSQDASDFSGVPLFSGGLHFVRMTDDSDPSCPTELLCLVDEFGNILLRIVLPVQSGYGSNTVGTSDEDLSAPSVYATP
jgi:hypothetical protein